MPTTAPAAQNGNTRQRRKPSSARRDDEAPIIPILARKVREVEAKAQRGKLGPTNHVKFQVIAFLVREERARVKVDTAIPDSDRTLITWLAVLGVAAAVADAGLNVLQRLCSAYIGESLIFDLRSALFIKVIRMPIAFFTRTPTGAITSRLSNDVVGAQTAVTNTLGSVVSNVIVLVTSLIAMLILDWRLTLLALVSRKEGWELVDFPWWTWLVLAVPGLLLSADLWIGARGVGFAGRRGPALALLAVIVGVICLLAGLQTDPEQGERRALTDLRKHMAWYLKGYPVGGDTRRALAMVSSFAELDTALATLDPDLAFPVTELGTPRGRQGAPKAKVALPEHWLDDSSGASLDLDDDEHVSGG